MPRPCKRRRICALPDCERFGPRDGTTQTLAPIVMTVDEFETIRLIDLESMTQEQCAVRMNVARTTVQAIYNAARTKLAQCLVYGHELRIEGGDYVLCDGNARCGNCGRRHLISQKEEGQMRIAVPNDHGEIFQHFGHTEQFQVYDVKNGQIAAQTSLSADGNGHGALAALLQSVHVDALICGGIGGGARMALEEAGIKLYGGVTGSTDEAVGALLNGTLRYDPDVRCGHHDESHAEGHSCGEHGCGQSHCGEHQ